MSYRVVFPKYTAANPTHVIFKDSRIGISKSQVNKIEEIKQWLVKSRELEYNRQVKRCNFCIQAMIMKGS